MTDCLHMLYSLNTVGIFIKSSLLSLCILSDVNLYLFYFYSLIDCQLLLENLLIRVQYITQTDIMLVLFILCYLISYRHSPSYLQVHGYHFIWRFESWFSHVLKLGPIRSHICVVLVLPNEGSWQVFPRPDLRGFQICLPRHSCSG